MKVKIEVDLKPFNVPNFVVIKNRSDGIDGNTSFALNELDESTIWALCAEFCNEVYKKAGVQPPPTCG